MHFEFKSFQSQIWLLDQSRPRSDQEKAQLNDFKNIRLNIEQIQQVKNVNILAAG